MVGLLAGMAIFFVFNHIGALHKRNIEAKLSTQDPANQIRFVSQGDFHKKRIMNKGEVRVFYAIESLIKASNSGHRIFAQTSLGEIIGSEDKRAFDCINAKRVDFIIIDSQGWPVVAVEYQGSGHYQGTAVMRDAVKKEALRRASVAYLEILAGDDEETIRRKVREALRWNDAAADRAVKASAG